MLSALSRDPAEPPRLLTVALQNLVAGRADLGTVLLQAGQDHEIALIDHGTAEFLHVARTGLLLRLRTAVLSQRCGRNGKRQQGESQENFTHRVPSYSDDKKSAPDRA